MILLYTHLQAQRCMYVDSHRYNVCALILTADSGLTFSVFVTNAHITKYN